MVHRDPETGQFVADDDGPNAGMTYNDYKFTNATIEFENTDSNNSTSSLEFTLETPSLDNDELAGLAVADATLTCRVDPDSGTSNTSPGSLEAWAEIGANLSGDYLFPDGGDTKNVTDNDAGTIQTWTAANDNPGTWLLMTAAAEAGFQDGTSTAGGGSSGHDRVHRDFRQDFGEGPWIDATDDVGGRISVNKNTTASDGRASMALQLGWIVIEDQHARPAFGRPF